jgi:hypothetical protein
MDITKIQLMSNVQLNSRYQPNRLNSASAAYCGALSALYFVLGFFIPLDKKDALGYKIGSPIFL